MDRLEGTDAHGRPVEVDIGSGRWELWFMTSSCRPCRKVWPRLRPGDVAITPDPATESRRKVAALAPGGVTVVMSSPAWFSFRVGPAPWRIVVEDGRVVESGSGVTGGSGQPGP